MDFAPLVGLASSQHGVVLTRQLGRLGFGRNVVARMRRQGLLVPVRHGAFVVGRSTPSEWQAVVAAVLSVEGSVISHATAARLHALDGIAHGSMIELSVPHPRRPRLAGVVVHRTKLLAEDVQLYRAVPVTTPARTIIDMAGRLNEDVLARVIDEGCIARRWTPASILSALERLGWHTGAPVLRDLLQSRIGEPAADSILETRVIRALSCLGPFETHFHLVLAGELLILDMAWPAFRVAAECDGWSVRSRSRAKFDRDRRRDNLLAAHGWSVAHLTSAMSDDEMRTAVCRLLLKGGGSGQ